MVTQWPELYLAVTKVWREFAAAPEEIYQQGFEFIQTSWAQANA